MGTGGVVVRHAGELRFLPATVVSAIVACPPLSRVPGAPPALLGITHTGADIVPVVAAGEDRTTPLVVVLHGGEPVGLLGCEVVSTGVFEAHPPPLDVEALLASVRHARWILGEGDA